MAIYHKALKFRDLPPGQSAAVRVGGRQIALFNVGGTIHATENRCPHSGGPLGEGELEGNIVTCPLHQWRFDVTTGQCQHLPPVKLKRYEVKVENGEVFVKF